MRILTRREAALTIVSGIAAGRMLAKESDEAFPHFAAKTLDGEKITTESVQGKVVLIEFWATWCPPCKSDEPVVESLLDEFGKSGLIVLAVNMGEPRKKVKKYLESSPRVSKIVLAEDTTLAAICNANVYPIYDLDKREGRLAGVQRGAGEKQISVAFWQRADFRRTIKTKADARRDHPGSQSFARRYSTTTNLQKPSGRSAFRSCCLARLEEPVSSQYLCLRSGC